MLEGYSRELSTAGSDTDEEGVFYAYAYPEFRRLRRPPHRPHAINTPFISHSITTETESNYDGTVGALLRSLSQGPAETLPSAATIAAAIVQVAHADSPPPASSVRKYRNERDPQGTYRTAA